MNNPAVIAFVFKKNIGSVSQNEKRRLGFLIFFEESPESAQWFPVHKNVQPGRRSRSVVQFRSISSVLYSICFLPCVSKILPCGAYLHIRILFSLICIIGQNRPAVHGLASAPLAFTLTDSQIAIKNMNRLSLSAVFLSFFIFLVV